MSADTKIAYCDITRSPWIGCTKVSEGCAHCYAEYAVPTRILRAAGIYGSGRMEVWGKGQPRYRVKRFAASCLADERRAIREGRCLRIFPSLCDPFDEEVPAEWFADFCDVIQQTPHLIWLLLTKRPQNVKCVLPANVWLGVSVENQENDWRIQELLKIPAKRFVSYEPALGPLDLSKFALHGKIAGIDWAIVGGESGDFARPCCLAWIRHIIGQCKAAGIPCFVKQIGSEPNSIQPWTGTPNYGDEQMLALGTDAKGGDPRTWPEDLRVREFPEF